MSSLSQEEKKTPPRIQVGPLWTIYSNGPIGSIRAIYSITYIKNIGQARLSRWTVE